MRYFLQVQKKVDQANNSNLGWQQEPPRGASQPGRRQAR